MNLVMFSKMLQEFPVAQAARRIRELGFEGVDLTVRPGGHVEPERVGMALNEAVRAIKDAGLSVPLITTAITSAAEPHAEATAAAAIHEGIRFLKLGYWDAPRGKVAASIDEARRKLDGLERLAAQYHVTFGVHNHSGPGLVNCQPAVLWTLLKDRDPKQVAVYFDPSHAAIEGGDGGWRQSLELLGPSLRLLAVKDAGWKSAPGRPKATWKVQFMPLKDGLVPWPEVVSYLQSSGFDGPISFHSEYKGSHSWRDLTTPELIEQTAEDVAFFKSLISEEKN
jgi:sugar phosphate isomerase/epimerase